MAGYEMSGFGTYNTGSGDYTETITKSSEIEEDATPDLGPAVGTINDVFEVGEETIDNGLDFDETYIGTAVIDGVKTIVIRDSAPDNTYFIVPAGTDPNTITWPANLSGISIVEEDTPVCFVAGTRISTICGARAVEELQIGDRIHTKSGGMVPVKWIGRQIVSTRFGPADRLMPVRIAAGALGPNVPHSDLTVTADHAMLVDGVLCNAGALVNGTTITRVPLSEMGQTYTVYHIETEGHEIILANGAPAETFIDNVSRRAFDNYAEFEALYGDVPEMEELPLPRAMSARQVPDRVHFSLNRACATMPQRYKNN